MYPRSRGGSGHRLFITAFMIASKVLCDDTYSSQSWVIVAQKIYTLQVINRMEREMCRYLDWDLNVTGAELASFALKVDQEYGDQASR